MANNPAAIREALDALLGPQGRGRLSALGQARGMIWREGVVPAGGPPFPTDLSADLLDFGYSLLAAALELREANLADGTNPFVTSDAFLSAAEAIEAAVRRDSAENPDRGRHLVVCGAAFHLAGYAARAYSIIPSDVLERNLSSAERALALLLRRNHDLLREHIMSWLGDSAHSDGAITARLANPDDSFDHEDAAYVALSLQYYRAVGTLDSALMSGDSEQMSQSFDELGRVTSSAGETRFIDLWWVAVLTYHLFRDLWDNSLHLRLPVDPQPAPPNQWKLLRSRYIAALSARERPQADLWPSQLEAASRSVDPHDDLVIALPTSAGKTRIAELCILRALADGHRVVYVTPLRALSAQVERVLARSFVPLGQSVTSLYGASGATSIDVETLGSASIVVSTPEKLDFAVRQDPAILDSIGLIVFDEGHMIGLGSRELRYEVLIQKLLRRPDAGTRRIVCLSAMFNADDPLFRDFADWLRRDEAGEPINVRWRPTRQLLARLDWHSHSQRARLDFLGGEKPFVPRFFDGQGPKGKRKNTFPTSEVEFCVAAADSFARDGHSILIYSPQRSQIEPLVRAFSDLHRKGYVSDIPVPEESTLAVAMAIGREWLGKGNPALEALSIGVGTHHGALPRPFQSAVEDLLDRKHISVVVASPTLAQGVDLSCSVLIFRSLQRFDAATGQQKPISPAEFANVVGRAGRAFVDLDGITVLPSFQAGWKRERRHKDFDDLVKRSRGDRLISGLARLIREIALEISKRLDVSPGTFVEYVTNQLDWTDPQLDALLDDDDGDERTFHDYVADLDVALLSLVDPLDCDTEQLATVLDEALQSSLWARTLARVSEIERGRQSALIASRARAVWATTTPAQRTACYFAGVGRGAGVFLYNNADVLATVLANLHATMVQRDVAATAGHATRFASLIFQDRFFAPRSLPKDWQGILAKWVGGVPFADILSGFGARDSLKAQSFVQDSVAFKLVWAAEAVRAFIVAKGATPSASLGDGPAFAFTYGVPSIPAALLCQIGFASRAGAVYASSRLSADFESSDRLADWLREHSEQLGRRDFWQSDDQHLLWTRRSTSGGGRSREWRDQVVTFQPDWLGSPPQAGTRVRVIPRPNDHIQVCDVNLTPLGGASLTVSGAILGAVVGDRGEVVLKAFGP